MTNPTRQPQAGPSVTHSESLNAVTALPATRTPKTRQRRPERPSGVTTCISRTRPTALVQSKIKRTFKVPTKFIAPFTRAYAMAVDGDCLAPIVNDGDRFVAAEDAPPVSNMPVAVYLRDRQPLIKILVAEPAMMALFGLGDSETVCVRMLNPPGMLRFPLDQVEAVHGGVGVIRADGAFERFEPLADLLMFGTGRVS